MNCASLFNILSEKLGEESPGGLDETIHLIRSFSAKVGFAPDFAAVSPLEDDIPIYPSERSDSAEEKLSWPLEGCRLDKTNVLV